MNEESRSPLTTFRWAITLAIVLFVGVLAVWPARATSTDAPAERLVELTDEARGSHGLVGYEVTPDLVDVARRQAERMAVSQRVFHNPNVASDVTDWQTLGENVAAGASADQVHEALMQSRDHLANILSPDFTQVGIATATGVDGRLYVCEVFRLPLEQADPRPEPAAEPGAPPAPPASEPPAVAPAPTTSTAPREETLTVPSDPVDPAPAEFDAAPIAQNESPTLQAVKVAFSHELLDPQSHIVAELEPAPTPPDVAVWAAAVLTLAVLSAHLVLFRRQPRRVAV